jgi:hypothetical protein
MEETVSDAEGTHSHSDAGEFEFVADPERLDEYLNKSFSDSDSSNDSSTSSSSSSGDEFDDPFLTDNEEYEEEDTDDRKPLPSIDDRFGRKTSGSGEECDHVIQVDLDIEEAIFGNQYIQMEGHQMLDPDRPPSFETPPPELRALSMYTESVAHTRRRRHADHIIKNNSTQVPILCRPAAGNSSSCADSLLHTRMRMVVPGTLSVAQFCLALTRKVRCFNKSIQVLYSALKVNQVCGICLL